MKNLLLVLIACFALSFNAFAVVNLNTASQAELESVKGIGPSKAKAIIDYRSKSGPFKSVEDLDNVKGFGKKTVDKLRSDITVNGSTPAKAVGKTTIATPAKPDAKPK